MVVYQPDAEAHFLNLPELGATLWQLSSSLPGKLQSGSYSYTILADTPRKFHGKVKNAPCKCANFAEEYCSWPATLCCDVTDR